MNDRQLAALFMSQVLPRAQATAGLSAVKMARSFQPRMHGASSSPYLYFYKVGDHRHGYPQRTDKWNAQTSAMDHIETQKCETTFQFSAWIPQTAAGVTDLTESDILNAVVSIMQGDDLAAAFMSQGVGILRITDVRNPYIVDDHDQYEAVPTFDVVLTHDRIRVVTIPAITTTEINISRV